MTWCALPPRRCDPRARLRVGDNATLAWTPRRSFVFDDSFEHAAWHDGARARLALIADVWHPDMTEVV